MANRHFGKLADVWKHLVLAEVVAAAGARRIYDTHAGHALYSMAADEERRYGVLGFLEVAGGEPALARSAYHRVLQQQMGSGTELALYPAGPMIEILLGGDACEYWFCDVDLDSIANLRDTAQTLGLARRVQVVENDGMATVHQALLELTDETVALVYIDAFDHHAVGPAGVSAVDVCQQAAERGVGVVCWYGYDRAERRRWLLDELRERSAQLDWWCGDVMVTSPGADHSSGALGIATSPGTGFGLVCANVEASVLERCDELGAALARAYDGIHLPDGRSGGLRFTTSGTARQR